MSKVGQRFGFSALFLAAGFLTSCSSKNVEVYPVYSASQCGGASADITEILSNSDQQRIQQSQQFFNLESKSNTGEASDIDFDVWRVFLVSAGEKPTSGYSLSLKDAQASYDKQADAFSVTITLKVPERDTLLAQVLTHPCLIFKIKTKEANGKDFVFQMVSSS